MAVAGHDLAGQRGGERAVLALEHAALDLAAAHEFLDQDLAVMPERLGDRVRELLPVPALLMPTDEPRRAGLTNTGRPSSATTASKAGASPWTKLKKRAIGSPRSRMSRLATSLSIAAAEPRTPEPT